jgi:Ecdysteroid kinase-like family
MLPSTIQDLTPTWLTDALRPSGVLGDHGVVTGVRADDIGTGVGVFGIIARLHLTYRDAPADAPTSIIAKMPTDSPMNRQVGLILRLFEREGLFYRDLAAQVSLRGPRCYFTEMDVANGQFAILMEDLGHMEAGDQLAGVSPERAGAIIDELAKFQARWWDSPELDKLDWLPKQNDPSYLAGVPPIVTAGVAALETYTDPLPDGSLELARRVDAVYVDLMNRCAAGPLTIVHGDARLDNFFFDAGANTFTIIDWQLSLRVRGAYDVVYLMASSMSIENQNAYGLGLIDRYHRALAANGVDWDIDSLRAACAEHAAQLLAGPLSLIGTFDFAGAEESRATRLVREWVPRGFNLAFLLGVDKIVP